MFRLFTLPLVISLAGCSVVFATDGLTFDETGVYELNTTTGVMALPGGSTTKLESEIEGGIFQLKFESLEIGEGTTLRAIGSKPLEILINGDLTLLGDIDVSSGDEKSQWGAGAGVADCGNWSPRGNRSSPNGGAGGGGGSVQSNAGAGGDGDDGAAIASSSSTTIPLPVNLRGGCVGQAGEVQENGDSEFAAGGGGGGGLRIIAGGNLLISGNIFADGAGGHGGLAAGGGGGGGGSGGVIWLGAEEIIVEGGVTAKRRRWRRGSELVR